ncbi:hypothetical protein HRG_009620 [Hirsutella rhossiliensis]|uniref:Uncharacterized protein n=1 Tax=Hirsutella rhossiliensis TaxID=111463 RepID=A0A9P8MRI5_9HYPO|nr:uncharacterized protein HRG_09620 [Hirsutella rhossiliensis]KAH0959159.1 hypothetical protein HRG_09620 [Hirsutella rhossiliensis]
MATEAQPAARQSATGNARGGGRGGRGSGRGRGGRGGRGGGRGGNSNSATPKQTPNNSSGRAPTRRGRVKNFTDMRVQAAYDRQRDLKATYQMVANAVKPALEELCIRQVDQLLDNYDPNNQSPDMVRMAAELQQRYDTVIAEHDAALHHKLQGVERRHNAETQIAQQSFEDNIEDLYEQYYDGVLNRLRILSSLHEKNLPVDVRDDRFEYKAIDDDHLDFDFGPYREYLNGHLVPVPHLVEGTRRWAENQARMAEVEAEKEAAAAAKVKATKGRTAAAKRKPQGQPEGQPTPKKATRTSTRNAQLLPPAEISSPLPAKGLLAAAKEAAAEAEAGTPAAEEGSAPTSPEASSPRNGDVDAPKGLMSPNMPKNAGPADEYGVRMYTQRASDKTLHNRFIVPCSFAFESHEIGFRDSTNDPSRQKVKSVNKYTGTPNSSAIHLDHRIVNYDFSTLTSDDFDQDLIQKHNLHPRYGMCLPGGVNEYVEADPYVMPGKPVVFIANPSGRVVHASRSFQSTTAQRSADEAPLRAHMSAAVRRFCKRADVEPEHVAVTEYLESNQDIRTKSLGTADEEIRASAFQFDAMSSSEEEAQEVVQEEMATPEQPGGGMPALSMLAYATAFEEAKDATRSTPSASKTSRYDAIRDVFTSSRPDPAPLPDDDTLGLNFLARICNVKPRLPGSARQVDEAPQAALMPNSEVSRAVVYEEAPSVVLHGHDSVSRGLGQQSAALFTHNQPREPVPLQTAGAVHASNVEPSAYPVQQDPGMQHYPQTRLTEFPQHHSLPPQGHPLQDQNAYYPPPGYPTPNHRDAHMASGRPVDPGFNPRGMAGYGSEAPPPPTQAFGGLVFWPQHPQQGPSPIAPAAVPVQHQYPPPPVPPGAPHPRIPFSHNASAEPLPPLRPPRSRSQALHEEPVHDARMRSSMHAGMNPYYPPAPPRAAFPRGYTEPPHPASQPMGPDRVLPSPHHPPQQQAYMGSPPPPGFAHQAPQAMSPTFGNPPAMAGQMVQQSPPGTPQVAPVPMLHHRATPSNDVANGKYRKLQPAPVPAHRAWSNKPELKTIFYDHKETGASAALPNSGPTQIRGWNNQDAPSASFAIPAIPKRPCVRFALPPGMPSLRETTPHPRPGPKMVAAPMPTDLVNIASMAMFGFGAIPTIGSAESSERPLKKRLRPRRARN